MIKAVIFDCFGVLTTDGWLPFKQKYFGHDAALKQQATDLNKQVDAGIADYNDFVFSMAELARIPVKDARAQIEDNVANTELFEYIKTYLKPTFKISFLSNAGANWLTDLFTADQVALFDSVSLSCESGFVKPDPRAYLSVASELGLQPEECVFIDDQERYCDGARDVGMHAIIYANFEQCKHDLEQLLSSAA